MREIDTREYIGMLRELTEEGKEVSLMISGVSMTPFLGHHRDIICFKKPDRALHKGDMVFYQRWTGQYVMHRICRVKADGYYIVGDSQTEIDGPIKEEQIFGLITKVCRKGEWIGPGNFWWEFFEHVWLWIIPLRPMILGMYNKVYKFRNK